MMRVRPLLLIVCLAVPVFSSGALAQGRPLKILLTNDDGYDAPGLQAMHAALTRAGHQVTVVAPAGISVFARAPAAMILSPRARTTESGIAGAPVPSMRVAPTIAVMRSAGGVATSFSSWSDFELFSGDGGVGETAGAIRMTVSAPL